MRSEWSLIFFTLLTQIAVGSFMVLVGLNIFGISKSEIILPRELTLIVLYIILSLALIAMVSSFLHLGKSRNAFYTLSNIKSSWLSREILFFVLFVGTIFIYTILENNLISTINLRTIISVLGVLFGILTVFSMAKLYMLETVPAWNSINTFLQFNSTTIILGIISVCLSILVFNSSILNQLNSAGIYRIFAVLLLLFITISLGSFLYKIWALSRGSQAELESLKQIIDQNSILFYSRIILSVITILIITSQLLIAEERYSGSILILLSILIVLTEITARYLFYAGYNRIGV